MWRIEAEVQTNDVVVKDLVLSDMDRWRHVTTVNVTTREEDPWKGTVSLRFTGSSTVGVVAPTPEGDAPAPVTHEDDDAPSQLLRRFAAPSELPVEELMAEVPFEAFLPSPPPSSELLRLRLDPGDEDTGHPTTATAVYVVLENNRQRGNVRVTLSAEPLPMHRFDAWRAIDDMAVCEDRDSGYYRCKIRLQRGGTHIQVESTAHRMLDEVLAVAPSLTRAV